ncbi:non-specific serine/threonine protein kinase [Anaeramoeba flamelloides]|uniref:non-specific serine/threonine protein kinase n=1 Tax=Anaeramoeba flamelloides TaxID=1746091 RepID=A0ABQ8YTB7_9EUKA|nr:non-specific serine/threonine protein kinase [Anaeramoeba flamelloides]
MSSLKTGSTSTKVKYLKKNYSYSKTIGFGSFTKAKIGTNLKTGQTICMKTIQKTNTRINLNNPKIKTKFTILKNLTHPHVVQLYDFFESKSRYYLVSEIMPSINLLDLLSTRRFDEKQSRIIFQQILCGLQYCHGLNIVHCDLKAENLLFDDSWNVKIDDFSTSIIVPQETRLSKSPSSPSYASPKAIRGKGYEGKELDIWSCGVILYLMAVGELPFQHNTKKGLYQKIREGEYKPIPSYLSLELQDLISKIFIVNQRQRITIKQIMAHEWFKESIPGYIKEWCTFERERIILQPNEEIVKKTSKRLRMPIKKITKSLATGENPLLLTIYYLLFEEKMAKLEKRFSIIDNKLLSKEFSKEKSIPRIDFSQPIINKHDEENSNIHAVRSKKRKTFLTRTKTREWNVGIILYETPIVIMTELFRILMFLGFHWKVYEDYKISIKLFGSRESVTNQNQIEYTSNKTKDKIQQDQISWFNSLKNLEFLVQLFTHDETSNSILIDFQRLSGDLVTFYSIVRKITSELTKSSSKNNNN